MDEQHRQLKNERLVALLLVGTLGLLSFLGLSLPLSWPLSFRDEHKSASRSGYIHIKERYLFNTTNNEEAATANSTEKIVNESLDSNSTNYTDTNSTLPLPTWNHTNQTIFLNDTNATLPLPIWNTTKQTIMYLNDTTTFPGDQPTPVVVMNPISPSPTQNNPPSPRTHMTRRPTLQPTHSSTMSPTKMTTTAPTRIQTGRSITRRPTPTPSSLPTFRPSSSNPTLAPSTALPTELPTSKPTFEIFPLVQVDDGQSGGLLMCQGDCDSDSDCSGELKCLQREAGDPIPGCYWPNGDSGDSIDYCVDIPLLGDRYRLKMYWEPGFNWQDTTGEQQWCMVHSMSEVWSWCAFGSGSSDCEEDVIHITECSSTDLQQLFRFRELPSGEFMIEIGTNPNRCVQGRRLKSRPCDQNEPNQRWMAMENGSRSSVNNLRFEISQIGQENRCVTQHHHPREREFVEMSDCENERRSFTTYWQRIYN